MKIQARDRAALLQSLRAGVVPRAGAHLIQVGRLKEIDALLSDLERVTDGGSAFRVVIGEYGTGKTFFLNLVRSLAMERKLVVAQADLNPDRRLQGSNGQGRSLYAELMRNLSTRARPEGGALPGVVERFVSTVQADAGGDPDRTAALIRERLGSLSELVNGYDFATVIAAYWTGHEQGDEVLKSNALRWLRGEFTSKTDARAALGVRSIVDDSAVYDQLKLLARFVRLAGYGGLLIGLDEMVNLYKLSHTQARQSNYEQILRILNDCLQGGAEGLGFVLGGTPDFLKDPRRGLYSYAALQTRLAPNAFAIDGLVDLSGPVLTLTPLTAEDYLVLLEKVRSVHAGGDPAQHGVPDEALEAFMQHCARRLGGEFFRSPRSTITAFVNLLAVLEQNPGTSWQALLGTLEIERDDGGAQDQVSESAGDDELASLRI